MILDETQEQRDLELHELTGVSLEEIKEFKIASPECIEIYNRKEEPKTEKEYIVLYEDYKYLNLIGYLKTLMYTSTERSELLLKILRNTENLVCLDFGSGVGTHAIALLENGNNVSILDIDGPLLRFALDRLTRRGLGFGGLYYPHNCLLKGLFDLIICIGVLEHVFNPMKELDRMRIALKRGGRLCLEVSDMIKNSSGHFASSIKCWQEKSPDYLSEYFNNIDGVYIKK